MNEELILPPSAPWSLKKKIILAMLVFILFFLIMSVLYVSVISFSTCGPMTPAGAWGGVEATSETTGTIEFGAFTSDVSYEDFYVLVYVNQTASGYLIFPETGMGYMEWADGPSGARAYYFDYNPNGGEINPGDYIKFDGLEPSTHYYFELLHIPSYSTVSMTGDYPAFATGPEPPQLNVPSYDYEGTFDLPEYQPPPRPLTTREFCSMAIVIAMIFDVFLIVLVWVKME